ncbi:MAG: 16S rRNA (uracil(1498)-N(3))-methyltransferase [Gammaproteobacteria bacterium]
MRIYQNMLLQNQSTIRLDEKATHHLARVLRAAVGDHLTIFNGEGGEYEAVIAHIDKKAVTVELLRFVDRDVESPIHIYLAQGIARGEKMDFIVQKAVELGVSKIIPLVTERCNVRLSGDREEKRIEHWQSVIISACEQSGRNKLPEIMPPQTLAEWLDVATMDHAFVLSPHVEQKLANVSIADQSSVAVLIGPEGGLSDQEVSMANQKGFSSLNLGPRVLRTETATVAALSVLQSCYGDLK